MRTNEIAATIADRRLVRLWAIKNAEHVVSLIDDTGSRTIAKTAIVAARAFLDGTSDEESMLAAGRAAYRRAFEMEAGYRCNAYPSGGIPQPNAALAAACAAGTDDRINYAGHHAGNAVFNGNLDQAEFDAFHAGQLTEIAALASGGE